MASWRQWTKSRAEGAWPLRYWSLAPGFPLPTACLVLSCESLQWLPVAFKDNKLFPKVQKALYNPACTNLFSALPHWLRVLIMVDSLPLLPQGLCTSILPVNILGWLPLGLTGLLSEQPKGLSRIFSSTTIWRHQFFDAQPSLWSNSHIHTWQLEKPKLLINFLKLYSTI